MTENCLSINKIELSYKPMTDFQNLKLLLKSRVYLMRLSLLMSFILVASGGMK